LVRGKSRDLAPNEKIELLVKSREIFDRLRKSMILSKSDFTSLLLIDILFKLREAL